MRLAVISTPRAGNTWLRHLLGTAYQLPHMARHSLTASEWDALPTDVVLQIHWCREPAFVAELDQRGFRIVTIARHPLDVLISILHFCVYDAESEQWLSGAGGTEAPIYGAMPRSRSFIEYAKGPRATALLSVTPEWWSQPNVLGVRYEDLVATPEAELQRLTDALGPPGTPVVETVAKCAIGELRQQARNNHFWKGQPGLWRSLLPTPEVTELREVLTPFLTPFGYTLDADATLNAHTADANWINLVGGEVKDTIRRLNETYRGELHAKDAHIADVTARLLALEARMNASLVLGGRLGRLAKDLIQPFRRRRHR